MPPRHTLIIKSDNRSIRGVHIHHPLGRFVLWPDDDLPRKTRVFLSGEYQFGIRSATARLGKRIQSDRSGTAARLCRNRAYIIGLANRCVTAYDHRWLPERIQTQFYEPPLYRNALDLLAIRKVPRPAACIIPNQFEIGQVGCPSEFVGLAPHDFVDTTPYRVIEHITGPPRP